jgi:hypothetical protein
LTTASELELGIVWNVAYASLFDAAARRDLATERLPGVPADSAAVAAVIERLIAKSVLAGDEDYLVLRGEEPLLTRTRERATRTARFLAENEAALNFARRRLGGAFAGMSGGCAHGNSDDGDIDLFAVTPQDAAWTTLLRFIVEAKALGWRRLLCLNYVVDERASALEHRDFYTAYELISLRPLDPSMAEAHARLLDANAWARVVFPNFFDRFEGRLESARFGPSPGAWQNPRQAKSVPPAPYRERASRMIYRTYLSHRLGRTSDLYLGDRVIRLHPQSRRDEVHRRFSSRLAQLEVPVPRWI